MEIDHSVRWNHQIAFNINKSVLSSIFILGW